MHNKRQTGNHLGSLQYTVLIYSAKKYVHPELSFLSFFFSFRVHTTFLLC